MWVGPVEPSDYGRTDLSLAECQAECEAEMAVCAGFSYSQQEGGCFWASGENFSPYAAEGYDCHRLQGTPNAYELSKIPISTCLTSPPPSPTSPPDPPCPPAPLPSPPTPPPLPDQPSSGDFCGYTVFPESVSCGPDGCDVFQRCYDVGAQPAMVKSERDNAELLAKMWAAARAQDPPLDQPLEVWLGAWEAWNMNGGTWGGDGAFATSQKWHKRARSALRPHDRVLGLLRGPRWRLQ